MNEKVEKEVSFIKKYAKLSVFLFLVCFAAVNLAMTMKQQSDPVYQEERKRVEAKEKILSEKEKEEKIIKKEDRWNYGKSQELFLRIEYNKGKISKDEFIEGKEAITAYQVLSTDEKPYFGDPDINYAEASNDNRIKDELEWWKAWKEGRVDHMGRIVK